MASRSLWSALYLIYQGLLLTDSAIALTGFAAWFSFTSTQRFSIQPALRADITQVITLAILFGSFMASRSLWTAL